MRLLLVVGMLLVVNPGGNSFQAAALLALMSTTGVAVRDVLTRRIPSEIPTLMIAASGILIMTASGGLLSLASPWVPVTSQTLLYLAGAAIMVLLGNVAVIMAFRDVDISAVSPFRYTLIVWAVIAGMVAFGDMPTPLAWIGIMLIVGSGLYTLYRESITTKAA